MSIWQKYKPIIVMVPSLVALHYGWFWLQGNESIYPQQYGPKLEEQPIVTVSASIFTHRTNVFRVWGFPRGLTFVHSQIVKRTYAHLSKKLKGTAEDSSEKTD